MSKPKIRHLAIFVQDTDKVAKFYQEVFEMELVGTKGPEKSHYLSDGHITLAILPHSAEGSAPCGLNHFGFSVEDRAEITRRLVSRGLAQPIARPADRAYAEFRACDPEGNMFDLSESFEQTRRPDLVTAAPRRA
jgi:catechol 2,3-dioxygenase-like lactoylglutathione lyase family enzyme